MTFEALDGQLLFGLVYAVIGVLWCITYCIYTFICYLRVKSAGCMHFSDLLQAWHPMVLFTIFLCWPFSIVRIKEWYKETERLVDETRKSS